jgi:hypothetical protein
LPRVRLAIRTKPPLQNPDVLLDVFKISPGNLGQFVDRVRMAALDSSEKAQTLARQKVTRSLKAGEPSSSGST